jgi:hypothetical protein
VKVPPTSIPIRSIGLPPVHTDGGLDLKGRKTV